MKDSALIAIHSVYAASIYAGTKSFEFRRKRAVRELEYLVLYETYPTCAITGVVEVMGVLDAKPEDLWLETKESCGIDRATFQAYFAGVQRGYAYRLGHARQLKNPVSLASLGLERAPQFFQYLDSSRLRKLLEEDD